MVEERRKYIHLSESSEHLRSFYLDLTNVCKIVSSDKSMKSKMQIHLTKY